MLYIESHDRFDDVAFFDPSTGRLDEVRRTTILTAEAGPTRGHYARLAATLVILYRFGGFLWLRVGSQARNLDESGAEAKWTHLGGHSTLTLVEGGKSIAEVRYQAQPMPPAEPGNDPTPFADAEDWDFGLFVVKVLTDVARRARIYGGPPS